MSDAASARSTAEQDALEPLVRELAAWRRAGRVAPFWWRDDDVVSASPRLLRLARTAQRFGLPMLASVIPASMHEGLPGVLQEYPVVRICQHGFSHVNHEPAGTPPGEFGAHRAVDAALDDIRRGRTAMLRLFGDQLMPVFVAPWHVLRADAAAQLPALGLRGVSGYGPVEASQVPAGLQWHNVHFDVLDWGRPRADDVPPQALDVQAERIARALTGFRAGAPQLGRALGLLTHHRAMGDEAWACVETLLNCLVGSGAVRFLDPVALFSAATQPLTESSPAVAQPVRMVPPALPKPPAPPAAAPPAFNPLTALVESFPQAGEEPVPACPVCGGQRTGRLWQVPLMALPTGARLAVPDSPLDGLPLGQVPGTAAAQRLFCFDLCAECQAVYRNPRDTAPAADADPAARHATALERQRPQARRLARLLPAETRRVLHADCGEGALLSALGELLPGLELLGLSRDAAALAWLGRPNRGQRGLEMGADLLPPPGAVPAGSVDFILAGEALARAPQLLASLRGLLALLRPGGRLQLAVGYYGTEARQLLRPDEPLLFSRLTRDYLVQSLGCRLLEATEDGIRMRLTLEKT